MSCAVPSPCALGLYSGQAAACVAGMLCCVTSTCPVCTPWAGGCAAGTARGAGVCDVFLLTAHPLMTGRTVFADWTLCPCALQQWEAPAFRQVCCCLCCLFPTGLPQNWLNAACWGNLVLQSAQAWCWICNCALLYLDLLHCIWICAPPRTAAATWRICGQCCTDTF